MKFHNTLNPKLWDKWQEKHIGGKITYHLKKDVAAKLKEIANAFIKYLDVDKEAIKDVVITGSSASFNYTSHSDLDLHLKVDYDLIHEDCPIVEGYLWALKATFNKDHDISIYGIPVEVYAESIDSDTVHNGLFSLWNMKWIDEPKPIPPTDNDMAVKAKYEEIKEAADRVKDSEVAEQLTNKIYEMRKAGLQEVGEFSTENLAFKKLRDAGVLERLKAMKKQKVDKELSLESYNESDDDLTNFCIIIDGDYNWLEEYGTFKSCKAAQEWLDKNGEEGWMYSQLTKGEMKDLGIDEYGGYVNESIKESLKDEYKQAFDLLIKGENIVGTLDTDFGKQFVKDVESLYQIKSSKLKLRKAKELLKDLQGYLVDEQYDDYNSKIDKFMNNSKNESIKEYYEEDDCEDIPEEMHKEKYVTYFETPEGRQKYTTYHVYTDSTDDSYNELCDKRDNQLGMYNSYKELKDALKERAEKIAAKQCWTVKSIENLGEDDEYYRERNKLESYKESIDTDLLKRDEQFRYMMLDRMRQDCNYYLEHPHEKHLWAGNVKDQIETMKQLYMSLPEKPEWITMEEIEDLEKQMLNLKNNKNESVEDGCTWVLDMTNILDTLEEDANPDNVPFTTENLISFLNDYGYGLPMDCAIDEIIECCEDLGIKVLQHPNNIEENMNTLCDKLDTAQKDIQDMIKMTKPKTQTNKSEELEETLSKIHNLLNEALDCMDFKVGDKVKILTNNKLGTIKHIQNDVAEVDIEETNTDIPRTDEYYLQDLELV